MLYCNYATCRVNIVAIANAIFHGTMHMVMRADEIIKFRNYSLQSN